MKKAFSLLLGIFLILNFTMIGCTADTSDAWKSNTGEINLTDLTVTGNGVSVDGSQINITQGGDFTVRGTLANGMIYVNTEEKVKLRLSGVSITNSNGPAIFFDNTEEALITITEDTENYLSDGKEYTVEDADAALFSNDDLEINGNGKLTVTGSYKHGIAGDDDVLIENGVITVNSYEHGIKANDTLSITGGTIAITTETGKGMKAELEVIIDDGDIDITSKDEGIESKGTLTINGGDINITADEDGMPQGRMQQGRMPQGGMPQKEIPQGKDGGRGGMGGGMAGGRGNRGGFSEKVTVKVNGQEIKFDTDPVIKNDTTLVGYRAIMEALGATVDWDEATQTVTATRDDTVIVLTIGSLEADVNGRKHTLLKEPEIIGDSTMVPVRFISEQLGMNVGWDEASNLVTVDSK